MLERFSKVSNLNIIVIGDIILDEYINGTITRMSAEAPIPIVDKTGSYNILGGSANVAANIQSLGANAILLGTIGDDNHGNYISQKLKDLGISSRFLLQINKPTTVKTRVIVDGKQIFRVDNEETSNISADVEQSLLKSLRSIMENQSVDGIILQDYNKGIFTKSMIKSVLELSKLHKITTFVDPKFSNYWHYKGVDFFKPNKKELFTALNIDALSINDTMLRTRSKLNCKHIVCTLAQDGIAYLSATEFIQNPTEKVEVVDVSGAGDTTMSMIALAALLGYDAKQILELSNAAGRAACMKHGVSTITISDLNLL
ncbi:MAG: rfaE bifunctional protein kinase chain/domain [Saprospiraceae bacterium]|jgi:rfaE bifunctional protein kinase chain/domain